MPQTFRYDTHDHMFESLQHLAEVSREAGLELDACMGKTDFRSALLPPAQEHLWMCWSLLFNPEAERYQAAALFSYTFGNLGTVAGWFRTAGALQQIVTTIFLLAVFFYVDDVFWAATRVILPNGRHQAQWIAEVFNEVVCAMFSWELDPGKSAVPPQIPLLGFEVAVQSWTAHWRLGEAKRRQWCREIQEILQAVRLSPGGASKLCGKLNFLNSKMFNRLGRALLRPLIWRQCQARGPATITKRMQRALQWFLEVGIPAVLLYSDAEGNGRVGAVAIADRGAAEFLRGRVPKSIRRQLLGRATNAVAFELLAAAVAVCSPCPDTLRERRVVHFVDNTAALACIVRGFSLKRDLAAIAGRLWFEAAVMGMDYQVHYVPSKASIADGPSRDDLDILRGMEATERDNWNFPDFSEGLDSWLQRTGAHRLAL
ncbi:unnamed protein product [Prorocentrum cordatum]|uniref:Reverse transcriptase domain-containing protein n=1 Tax=Prorocentrum cordatum TaxID=2364126 RepID=A0ABN9S4H8_9DINO|nr:unnamed protein product [Polarella glacialis]